MEIILRIFDIMRNNESKEESIVLVVKHTNCTPAEAFDVLKQNDNNTAAAIFMIQITKY
jgi:NACalpha-BTF3-like transcription factor